MADLTLGAVTPLLQKAYDGDPVKTAFDHEMSDVFHSRCELESNGGGEAIAFEVISEGTALASPDYALAGGAMESFRFEITPRNIHFRARVLRESMDSAKGKGSKALYNFMKMALDNAIGVAMRKLYRWEAAINGEIGVVTAVDGSTFTIDTSLTNRLSEDMVLVGAATNGSGNLNGADPGTEEVVESWNDDTGVVTCTSAVSFSVGDTIWEKGDVYYNQAKPRAIAGAFGWCNPTAATNGENFYGQDRYDHPRTLQPHRISLSNIALRAAVLRLASRAYSKGIALDVAFIPTPQWTSFLETSDAREIVNVSVTKMGSGNKAIVIGAQAIQISNGAGGSMDLLQWPYMLGGSILAGNSKKAPFKLMYTDKLVRLHTDGQDLWRRIEGGILDAGEYKPALEAEGDIRVCLINKCPSKWIVGTGFTGAA